MGERILEIMKVIIKWTKAGWEVIFGEGHVTLVTSNYQKAFFWVKYQNQISPAFVMDYIHNK